MKNLKLFTVAALCCSCLFASCGGTGKTEGSGEGSVDCNHAVSLTSKTEATCTEKGSGKRYCGECGYVSYSWEIAALGHDWVIDEKQSQAATCYAGGYSVKTCKRCGDTLNETYAQLEHLSCENTGYAYIKTPNNNGTVEFYNSCKHCGEIMEGTFFKQCNDAADYVANSPTVTLYETENELSYGFTWNYANAPLTPTVAIKKSTAQDWEYYSAEEAYQNENVYVCKAVVKMDPDTNYDYKLIEASSGAESAVFSFTSADPSASSFSFASFSDSQNTAEDGSIWNAVLQKTADVDFYIHSGDICNDTSNEQNLTNMLNTNSMYLAKTPLMAVSGNHDTTYLAGENVVFNHFYNNIPKQESTVKGYFYSFVYGDVKFIMLNTNVLSYNKLWAEQYNWLVDELSNNQSKWTIVTMHNPLYSIGKYGSKKGWNDVALALREQLNDIFVTYGVDFVIQGHDHAISKTYPIGKGKTVVRAQQSVFDGITYDVNPQGVIYVMNGPTGNQDREAEGDVETEYYEFQQGSEKQSWAEYTVTENRITVSVKYLKSGQVNVYYQWGIEKS